MSEVFWAAIYSSGGTLAVVGAIGFLLKNCIVTKLTKSVEHKYDKKLAEINSELRSKEAEIGDIRRAAISNAMTGQGSLDKRRMEAIDDLWKGFLDSKKNIMAVHLISTLNLNEIAKSGNDPKVKQFIDTITLPINFDPEKMYGEDTKKASVSRPWVGPKIWTLYSAYTSAVFYPMSVFMALKNGVSDPLKFIKRDKVVQDLKVALPDLKLEWDNFSDVLLPNVLDILELQLLQEIEFIVTGKKSDIETHQRAISMAKNLEQMNKAANAA